MGRIKWLEAPTQITILVTEHFCDLHLYRTFCSTGCRISWLVLAQHYCQRTSLTRLESLPDILGYITWQVEHYSMMQPGRSRFGLFWHCCCIVRSFAASLTTDKNELKRPRIFLVSTIRFCSTVALSQKLESCMLRCRVMNYCSRRPYTAPMHVHVGTASKCNILDECALSLC